QLKRCFPALHRAGCTRILFGRRSFYSPPRRIMTAGLNPRRRPRVRQRAPHARRSNTMALLTGKCFCGAVEIEVSGAPEAVGYCHCSSCRSWSEGPVNAFTLWKPENVKVTKGVEFVGRFAKTKMSGDRRYCTRCGGHVLTSHPPLGLVDVYAATI